MIVQPEREEYITPDLKRYWLKDEHVVVYQPVGSNKDMVDAWFNAVLQGIRDWPDDRLYGEIHDMRRASANPGNQRVAMNLVRRMSPYHGRSAAIITESRGGKIFAYFINHVFIPFTGNIKRRVFFTIEGALDWLLEDE